MEDSAAFGIFLSIMFLALLSIVTATSYIKGTNSVTEACEKYGSYKTDNFEMTCEVAK